METAAEGKIGIEKKLCPWKDRIGPLRSWMGQREEKHRVIPDRPVSHVKSLTRVRLSATPRTVAHPAPLSMGFSRQEYRSGLPFPSLGDLPKPGIEPSSPVLASFSFASFWSLPSWGLWELCRWVTASAIPLRFRLGWIWRARTEKQLRKPESLTEK